jgi:hypothetical protein
VFLLVRLTIKIVSGIPLRSTPDTIFYKERQQFSLKTSLLPLFLILLVLLVKILSTLRKIGHELGIE